MRERSVLIFDGECGICTALADWVRRRDSVRRMDVMPCQQVDLQAVSPGLTVDMCRRAAFFIRADGRRFRGARAVFATLTHLPGGWRVLGWLGLLRPVSWLAAPVYALVARHRSRISRLLGMTACAVSSVPREEL